MKKRLNCWIVAMTMWLMTHGRQYAIVRRSHAFHGLIPHFLFGTRAGWKKIVVIEYVPPPKKQRWRTDFVLCFPGSYRVWEFRLTGVHRCATEEQALTGVFGHFGDRNDTEGDS
jgi:hypothetical protein